MIQCRAQLKRYYRFMDISQQREGKKSGMCSLRANMCQPSLVQVYSSHQCRSTNKAHVDYDGPTWLRWLHFLLYLLFPFSLSSSRSIQFFFSVKRSSFVLSSLPIPVPLVSIQWKKIKLFLTKSSVDPKSIFFFLN